MPGRPGTDRDYRLADRDDDHGAVALGEVRRRERPALGAEQHGPPTSTAIATSQAISRGVDGTNAATINSPTPSAALTASPLTERRSFGSPRLASRNRPIWRSARPRRRPRRRAPRRRRRRERRSRRRASPPRGEDHEPNSRPYSGLDDAGQPRVADPRPPQDGQGSAPRAPGAVQVAFIGPPARWKSASERGRRPGQRTARATSRSRHRA